MKPSDVPQPRKGDELDDIDQAIFEFAIGREKVVPVFVRSTLLKSQPSIQKLKVAVEALCHKRELLARKDEHIQISRLLNATMQNDAGYDKPITPEDIRNVIYDRYVTLTKEAD